MGCSCSKPVDEPVVETSSKGGMQQGTRQETQQGTQQETQQEPPPKGGTPSKGQRARDTVILLLTFTSIIADASDILKPMKAVSEGIKKILEVTKSVQEVDDDWNDLIRRLKSHRGVIESHTNSLEEDESLAETPPPLHPDIVKPLQAYVDRLEAVYKLLNSSYEIGAHGIKKVVDVDHNKRFISGQTSELNDAFRDFTFALQYFVARKVDQMQQDIGRMQQDIGMIQQDIGMIQQDIGKLQQQGEILKRPTVYGHQHSRCLQGTRVSTLRTIRAWAADDNTATSRIFCLLDIAGSGKSTVAKEVVEKWEDDGWLVGRFFFSRDTPETMSTREFCETVSDSFASNDRDLKPHIDKFKERPDWKRSSFERQYEGLVAGPLRALDRHAILTIDALDECEDPIELLKTLFDKQFSVPLLRTLITGRPEDYIKKEVMKVGIPPVSFRELEGKNQDVENYIRSRLEDEDIQKRVMHRAEGLFIWARLACDLLSRTLDTNGLLADLEDSSKGVSKLDSIYGVALKQATQDNEQTIIQVLQMVLAMRTPLSSADLGEFSPWTDKYIVQRAIARLGSLLLSQDPGDPIRLLHATFREFLTSRERAGKYFIQLPFGHRTLARGSLKILDHYSSSDGDSFGGHSRGSLLYASNSWAHHCAESCTKLALIEPIREFTKDSLPTWISRITQLHGYRFSFPIMGVLLLSHGNKYPQIMEALLDRSLEQIRECMAKAVCHMLEEFLRAEVMASG